MSTSRNATKKPYVRRSSALRGKPLSSMPVNRENIHSLYIEIASLQMTRARHEKVREALAQQVRRSEEAILEAEQAITHLLERIALAEGSRQRLTPKPVRPSSGGGAIGGHFLYDY